jgi:FkbM family methyltransferase
MITSLINYFSFTTHGIIHVGANDCAEHDEYSKIVNNILWVEANEAIVERVRNERKFIKIIAATVSDRKGDSVTLHVSNNNGQSSSILDFAEHSKIYPEIKFIHDIKSVTTTIDDIVIDNDIDNDLYNVLVLDIQGVELRALKGASNLLKSIDIVHTEVNIGETYIDCDKLSEIDAFLGSNNYVRFMCRIFKDCSYGDAIYVKQNILQKMGLRLKVRRRIYITLQNFLTRDIWF